MSLDILATYSLKLRYSASYRISYVVISVVSVSSILTIQDVIKVVEVSTATEPWGVWDLPAVSQTDAVSEFYIVKGVG